LDSALRLILVLVVCGTTVTLAAYTEKVLLITVRKCF